MAERTPSSDSAVAEKRSKRPLLVWQKHMILMCGVVILLSAAWVHLDAAADIDAAAPVDSGTEAAGASAAQLPELVSVFGWFHFFADVALWIEIGLAAAVGAGVHAIRETVMLGTRREFGRWTRWLHAGEMMVAPVITVAVLALANMFLSSDMLDMVGGVERNRGTLAIAVLLGYFSRGVVGVVEGKMRAKLGIQQMSMADFEMSLPGVDHQLESLLAVPSIYARLGMSESEAKTLLEALEMEEVRYSHTLVALGQDSRKLEAFAQRAAGVDAEQLRTLFEFCDLTRFVPDPLQASRLYSKGMDAKRSLELRISESRQEESDGKGGTKVSYEPVHFEKVRLDAAQMQFADAIVKAERNAGLRVGGSG